MIRPYLKPRSRASIPPSWTVRDLCAAYQWPTNLTGDGIIGIVELGGGYLDSDIAQFCRANGIPAPLIVNVSVDGSANAPGQDEDADGECALDIQVAAASYSVATGRSASIRVYWCQNIAAGIQRAAADGCDVCSVSWGQDEALWSRADANALELTIMTAAQNGMVTFVASGDNDSSDGGPDPANVDLPAGCPHAIGCGGTSKTGTETVWNNNPGETDGSGTGGGFSTLFPLEPWQIGAPNGPGRMVPDVAALADPETGYEIVMGGSVQVVGGTSAVAPLYAGLFAAFGAKLGWIGPTLWKSPLAFEDVTVGNNGLFRAGIGPDPCCGLGVPNGGRLARVFGQ